MIIVSAILRTKPGMRDKVVELAHPCIEATRKENGCIQYDLLRSTHDENTLMYAEQWESLEALRAHNGSPHIAAFREARKEMMDGALVKIFDAKEVKL